MKVGAVTVPPNFAAPSEALISATTDGVVDEFVPLSNVQPKPLEFSIKLLLAQAVTSVPEGAVILAFTPLPVVVELAI